jgi:hypothetical protein
MLIDEPRVLLQAEDPILRMIGTLNGNKESCRLTEGVYQITSFGSSDFLRDYNQYPDIATGCYGVCDNHEQILEQNPELSDPSRQFVITLTPVVKANQSPDSGWRWHKWGEYIGTQNRSGCEYLYDEPEIEQVFCYHVYEKKLG